MSYSYSFSFLELLVVPTLLLYVCLGTTPPYDVCVWLESWVGKGVMVLCAVSLAYYAPTWIAIVGVGVLAYIMYQCGQSTGFTAVQHYALNEDRKMSELTAFNQFPYTLEQEMVAKMTPQINTGMTLTSPSYVPFSETTFSPVIRNT